MKREDKRVPKTAYERMSWELADLLTTVLCLMKFSGCTNDDALDALGGNMM